MRSTFNTSETKTINFKIKNNKSPKTKEDLYNNPENTLNFQILT